MTMEPSLGDLTDSIEPQLRRQMAPSPAGSICPHTRPAPQEITDR